MAQWNVREGRAEDASDVMRIFNGFANKNYLCEVGTVKTGWSLDRTQHLISTLTCTILEMDGQIVGFILTRVPAPPVDYAEGTVGGVDLEVFTKPKDILDASERLTSAWLKHLFMLGVNYVQSANHICDGKAAATVALLRNPYAVKRRVGHSSHHSREVEIITWNVATAMQWYADKGL